MKAHDAQPNGKHDHPPAQEAIDRPREATIPSISPDDAAAVVVQLTISVAHKRLVGCEESARKGDVEGVHRLRTSTRRARSALRVFRELLDGDWADLLADELKWLADKLGAVRDLDILQSRLAGAAAGESESVLSPLFQSFRQRHRAASRELRDALVSKRYKQLLKRLEEAAERPPLEEKSSEPCCEVLPALVDRDWNRLKKRARRLEAESPDTDFHEVRKRAKRARYASEAVSIALDPAAAKRAAKFARLATAVQDVLGEHQDAVVACQEIRRAVEAHPDEGPFNFAAGRLFEKQMAAAIAARTKFFPTWEKLDHKKNRSWLKV